MSEKKIRESAIKKLNEIHDKVQSDADKAALSDGDVTLDKSLGVDLYPADLFNKITSGKK